MFGRFGEEKNLLPLLRVKPRIVQPTPFMLQTYRRSGGRDCVTGYSVTLMKKTWKAIRTSGHKDRSVVTSLTELIRKGKLKNANKIIDFAKA